MTEEKWLIAVGAGRWQMPGIRAARQAGLKVLAVDGLSDAPGLMLADQGVVVDIRVASQVIAAIQAKGTKPSGAISFCNEAGMLTTAALREHFKLPGVGAVQALTNKGEQRGLWTMAGLPCPKWFVVTSADDVPKVLNEINGKSIFKPVDSAGSRGVTVVEAGQPWDLAFELAFNGSLVKSVIIESFIEGVEHTVETFTHRGVTSVLAITSKKKVEGTSQTVAYELTSAQLSEARRAEVTDIVTRALAALRYDNGPGHTEFLLARDGRIYLVETAGRGGGFMVADGIVPAISGFDLATACALQAVGLEPNLPQKFTPKAAVLRFLPSKKGRVVSIEGFTAADQVEGVQSESLVTVGQCVRHATTDGDRMAFILSVAESVDEALRLADEKETRIRIKLL